MSSFRYILVTFLVTTLVHSIEVNAANKNAPLKPLTPIAGTNLYLNFPYKWHDHTKPGCYATWFMESYQDFSDKYKGVSLVCNTNDQKWYDTADANWIFERTAGEESVNEYKGTIKLKNVGATHTLENWKSADTWWVGLGGYRGNAAEDMWNIRIDPKNKNFLQLEIQNWFLAQHKYGSHRAFLYLTSKNEAKFPYSFVPTITLEAEMTAFNFDRPNDKELKGHTSQKGFIDAFDVNNNGNTKITRQVAINKKVTDEFSWGFSESFKFFGKVKGKIGVPLVAEGEVEAGYEFSLGATQNWKNTKEKTFTMSYTVEVPPNTRARISAWYDLIENVPLNYTATAEITGKTSRITIYDDIIGDSTATGEMIRTHLIYTNFEGKIIEVRKNSVIAKIKGTLVATAGVRGQLTVDGKTVAKADIKSA